jgi:rhamnulose-1-phosphate aldolase
MIAFGIAPTFEAIITDLADAGQTLVQIHASEGAAGNLSAYLAAEHPVPAMFTETEIIELPVAVPELSDGRFVVSGSGTRMRDIRENPGACLAILAIRPEGTTATLHYAPSRSFARITSEFNSHLAVHRAIVTSETLSYHAIVHAQPRQLTYLSHLSDYQNSTYLNRRLLRWQPEAILNFPEGIGILPFLVPGQPPLMAANEQALRAHRLVVWAKHGVMARSDKSAMAAVDLIEYAETAAAYECLDRMLGGHADGLSPDELKRIAQAYRVEQRLY